MTDAAERSHRPAARARRALGHSATNGIDLATAGDGVNVGPVSVQAWFSNDEVEIEPGSTIKLTLSVHNLGQATDSFTIVPSGLTANWVNVERANVTLFAGSQDVVDVEISPPLIPSTTAGPTVVGVRIIPNDDPDDTIVAETTLDVQPFDDRRIVALQPVLRARRRATYEFMVENNGNGLASCRLRLIDATDRIDGTFDPPAVGVAPGGASLVLLRARATRGFFRRSARTLDFEVEAEQPGHPPAASALSMIQPPTIPGRALGRVAVVLVVLAAAAGAWFGVVRPEIRNAAEDRVDERLARLEGIVDEAIEAGSSEAVPETTTPGSGDATALIDPDAGEPTFFRLEVSPALNATSDDSSTVPEGQLFDITDIRVENSNNDAGRAILSINGEDAFVWNLQNVRGSLFEPRITRIRLAPGDNVTFSVRCDAVGDPVAGTCVNAVNIGGLQVEIDEI